MDKKKALKIATARLESQKTHRIDLLRAASGMNREEFDKAVLELAGNQEIELVGGDTSDMTDEQIRDLLKTGDNIFVNIVWLIPIPSKARARMKKISK
ncbi:MAG: hypothetical protein GY795_26445 [Desulfobacterales bacterium]|nr:hypothetical protein [Desulfobacterales bacterium]